MDKNAAIEFVLQNARPLELAIYKYFFENESNQTVVDELLKFQNPDGGFCNAFTLQRLLGHSTLDMTKHYCAIFDKDITKNYDAFSPLNNFKSNSERIKLNK